MTGITREQLEPYVVNLRRALAVLKEEVDEIGDDQVKRNFTGAYLSYVRAVDSWSTTQRDEVLAGSRPLSRWVEFYDELLKRFAGVAEDAGDFYAKFSGFTNAAGDLANSTLKPLEAKVADLKKQLADLEAQDAAWRKVRDALRPRQARLSPEVRDIYFGPPADRAQAVLARYRTLVRGVEAGVGALRTGKVPDFLALVREGESGLKGGLGHPFVGVAGALAVMAIAAALAAALWAFFRHADEVTRTEYKKLELQAVRDGHGAEVLALRKLQTEAEKPEWTPTEIAVAGVALVGVVGVGGYLLHRWWKGRNAPRRASPARAVNPKRRKKKSANGAARPAEVS